ncbi:MAG: hypothetical protein Q9209_000605 [Squamulea sp. 1 TL-2023]
MSWRYQRLQRILQPSKQCRRSLSSTKYQPLDVASALALRPCDDRENVMIQVAGTVRTIRKQKNCAFLQIGDGSTVHSLQAVLNPDHAQGYETKNDLSSRTLTDHIYLNSLSTGAFVAVQGLWRPAPPGKEQSHELRAQEVITIGAADSEKYPIQKKFQTPEFLRTIPHLRLRLPLHALLARLRSESEFLLAQYFRDQGFLRVQAPVITSSDCEGAGEVFSLRTGAPISGERADAVPEESCFFRRPKYLTVSSQLHLEAYMQEHHKVWTFSPTFRAEKSDTPRHVSEFWMLEVELRTQSLEEIMELVEGMIMSLVQGLQRSSFIEELATVRRLRETSHIEDPTDDDGLLLDRWMRLAEGAWPRITYTQALHLLQDSARSGKSMFVHQPNWETGLQLEHERYLAATVGQGKPVFVTDYPQVTKPFYMLPSATERIDPDAVPGTAACFDLLLPEVSEVVGGSLREHRLKELEASMQKFEPEPERRNTSRRTAPEGLSVPMNSAGNMTWYLDLRRFGSVPHGGFGLGFDRLLCYLTGMRNIKDVITWPRFHGRCDC